MKRYTYYILVVLMASVSLTVQAQAEQDALYIYRNDGGFNAFFFDDIDHFEYSCIDTLGVEHDDYVTQEVHALDSIFRIPLTAIDSIAFVTPETVYKEDIIKIDKSIAGHVIASDSVNWICVDNSTPENLIPKKGDKILITETNRFMPEGFGGRVTSVDKTTAGTTITTEALPIEEAFESAVFKMAVNTELDSQTSTRGDEPVISTDGPVALGPYIGSAGLTGSKELINGLDIFSVSATPLGAIRYEVSPTINFRAFFTFNKKDGVHIASYADIDGHINVYAKLEGTLSARIDVPFPKAGSFYRLTYNNPDDPVYFKGLFKVGLFVEGTAMITLDGGFDGQFHAAPAVGYIKPVDGEGHWVDDKNNGVSFIPNEYGVEYGFGDFTFSTGAFFECSLDCKQPLIKSLNGFGLRMELGDKFTLKSPALVDIPDNPALTVNVADYNAIAIYDLLDKDDIVKSDIYFSIDPYVKWANWQSTKFKKTYDLYSWKWGVVPDINVYRGYPDGGPFAISGEYELKRKLLGKCKVGMAVLDQFGNMEYTYWRPEPYEDVTDNTTVSCSFELDPLKDDAITYHMYPMVTYLGKPILYYERYNFKMDPAYVTMPDKIELNDKEVTEDFDIPYNVPDVTFFTTADWIDDYWYKGTLQLHHGALPDNLDSREAKLCMVAKNKEGEVLLENEIPIIQKGSPDRIKFTVSPTSIDVPGYSTEFQNGHLTKQFTVTYPRTATALTVTSSDDSWLTADNGGGIGSGSNTCNVSIKANTSLKNSRKGTITVLLTKSDGSTDTKTITVNQSALNLSVELKPDHVTLDAEEKEDNAKTVNIEITPYDDFIASLIKRQEVTPNIEWIKASRNGFTILISGENNPVNEARENKVTYSLTLTTGEIIERTIKVTQLKKEGGSSIEGGTLHFDAEGGTNTFTIDHQNVDHITNVNSPYGWIGLAGSGKTLTVDVKANPNTEERTGSFSVNVVLTNGSSATLYYQVTQDAGSNDIGIIANIKFDLTIAETQTTTDELAQTTSSTSSKLAKTITISPNNGEIKTTRYGSSGIHVTCSTQTFINPYTYNYVLSFDIDDMNELQSRMAMIYNVDYKMSMHYSFGIEGEVGYATINQEERIEIPSLPMTGESIWGGTAEDGIVFNNFVDKAVTTSVISVSKDGEEKVSSTFKIGTINNDPNNKATISIDFNL